MNAAQQIAIANAIVYAKDDLYRAELQARHNPNWKSWNGETIQEVIAQYRAHIAELEAK